jgi:hypothetical protein
VALPLLQEDVRGDFVDPWALSRASCEQPFGLLEISGVKALGEPAVDRCQHLIGFPALALPQPSQAQRRPQFAGFGSLVAGNGEGLLEAGCGLDDIWDGLLQ